MKAQFTTTDTAGIPAIKPLAQFARDMGKTATTTWRWRKAGWIDPADVINIAGKPYITGAGIEKFLRRAQAGEFAQAPHAPRRNAGGAQ